MRSRAKEPPNCSTTGRSRSSSPTKTATKPSSKQNETLLQQPASAVGRLKAAKEFEISNNPEYPLAIWYGGMLAACDNVDKVMERLRIP